MNKETIFRLFGNKIKIEICNLDTNGNNRNNCDCQKDYY